MKHIVIYSESGMRERHFNDKASAEAFAATVSGSVVEYNPDMIKRDENFNSGFEFKKQRFALYTLYTGLPCLQYYAYWNDQLLFEGAGYKPSSMYNIDEIAALVDLLCFLTVRDGQADSAYFESYTHYQLIWIQSQDCYELSRLVSDFSDKRADHYKTAKRYFEKHFIQHC